MNFKIPFYPKGAIIMSSEYMDFQHKMLDQTGNLPPSSVIANFISIHHRTNGGNSVNFLPAGIWKECLTKEEAINEAKKLSETFNTFILDMTDLPL